MFALGLDAFIVAGILPRIAGDFSVELPVVGQMVTAFTLSYAVCSPIFAALLSSWRTKSVLILSMIIFVAANTSSAIAVSTPALFLTRAAAGLAAGLYAPLAATAAASLVSPERRGKILTIISGSMSSGAVAGVPLGLLLANAAGWRTALWSVAAIGTVAFGGLLIYLPNTAAQAVPTLRQRCMVIADRKVASIISVTFLGGGIASLGLYTYIAPVLHAVGGISDLAGYIMVWGGGGVTGSIIVGPLIDYTARPSMLTALILAVMALAMFTLSFLGHFHTATIVALAAWGAAGWALTVPQQHRLIAAYPRQGAVAVAVNSSALYLGSAAGTALIGFVLSLGWSGAALPLLTGATALCALLLHLAFRGWS